MTLNAEIFAPDLVKVSALKINPTNKIPQNPIVIKKQKGNATLENEFRMK